MTKNIIDTIPNEFVVDIVVLSLIVKFAKDSSNVASAIL